MTIFEELQRRGLIAQCTDQEEVEKLLNGEKAIFYIGFDATADSLHIGHYMQLSIIARMQKAGHLPIVLLGTGTTMIGDPTGKTDMRKMLTIEQINYNAEQFRKQMERFVDFSEGKAIIVRNGDWLLNLNYIELLRDVGVHFSVNRMLAAECVKSRLARGLSFLEFNYMIMQSYDFLRLNREYNCQLQLGGDDQWSNIIEGVDLIRRVDGKKAYGLTFTLLTTKEGKKMGKTEKGALWLDRNKTSPYEFYQYWRNICDEDVINCMKLLTFIPIEEIEDIERNIDTYGINNAKERLAYEMTKTVHGEKDADESRSAAKALFGAGGDTENMPSTELSESDFTDGKIAVADLLVKTGIAPSKGEAKRLIQQGGISINGEKIDNITADIGKEKFSENVIIKKGKKIYHKAVIK
ncbi:MAG: tyrosine--tRNA ligase [Oscillospiraceae bacterium]|nr:tyrosine--tRNA ligase [Oscillospiraceae bacterium]